MDTGIDIDNETNTRHCKNLQQSQSHSVEQIFAPWLKKIWINFGTQSTLRHTAFRISKRIVFCNHSFFLRLLLVPKNYKILTFLTEVKKVSPTLP